MTVQRVILGQWRWLSVKSHWASPENLRALGKFVKRTLLNQVHYTHTKIWGPRRPPCSCAPRAGAVRNSSGNNLLAISEFYSFGTNMMVETRALLQGLNKCKDNVRSAIVEGSLGYLSLTRFDK
ncbi:hypothetical protein LguiB_005540 [Lonicera macranthoides]